MSARPDIVIQVLPYDLGAHPAMESNFTILELPAPSSDVVFVEGLIGSVYLDREYDLDRYHAVFQKLQSMALNPQDTGDLVASLYHIYSDNAKRIALLNSEV
jgi:uncharacterized protein DUF5753